MNTRLQVEHPVTEGVTGLDLVEWQLRVARGETLTIQQEDVVLLGHAIEVRLYAEDTAADFLPSTGSVNLWHVPERADLRVDSGVETGDEISPFYDPMVAKIITYGDTREDARSKMVAALQASALLGVSNNRDFLIDALQQEDFVRGEATTAFIAEHYGDNFSAQLDPLMPYQWLQWCSISWPKHSTEQKHWVSLQSCSTGLPMHATRSPIPMFGSSNQAS